MRNTKGITLIALVITVIILLILAGITINLTIGQRGILTRAQAAGKNYQEAAKKEEEELEKVWRKVDNIIIGIDTPNEDKYTMVDGVPVPNGFVHVDGTKENGFVIEDISVDEAKNPTRTNGNEFVWVPCTEDGANGSIKYDRYAFSRQGWKYTQTKEEQTEEIIRADQIEYNYTETMSSIELSSIKKYGGFYIGRYEVGIEGYDEEVKRSNENKETEWTGYSNGNAVVQADKQVWNYITKDMAKKVAEGMYANNNVVTSRLCSSYAWDTTLKFIETKNEGYATNSEGDNYSERPENTGIGSTAKNHIYDMGGNVTEWTTEFFNYQNYPCTQRGGVYGSNKDDFPAAFRDNVRTSKAGESVGFRVTLFIGV